MMARAIAVAAVKRAVATTGGRSPAATEEKNSGKTATTTVDQKAELAQSYIAHARTSRRSSPRRARRRLNTGPQ